MGNEALESEVKLGPWRRAARVMTALLFFAWLARFTTTWSWYSTTTWVLAFSTVPLGLYLLTSARSAVSGMLRRVPSWTVLLAVTTSCVFFNWSGRFLAAGLAAPAAAGLTIELSHALASIALRADATDLGPLRLELRPALRFRWAWYPDPAAVLGFRRTDTRATGPVKVAAIAAAGLLVPMALVFAFQHFGITGLITDWELGPEARDLLDGFHPWTETFAAYEVTLTGLTLANLIPVANPGDPWTDVGRLLHLWRTRPAPAAPSA